MIRVEQGLEHGKRGREVLGQATPQHEQLYGRKKLKGEKINTTEGESHGCVGKNYGVIEECPTIQLSNAHMQGDPVDFFMKLEKQYEEFGAVKLIASQGWNPPFTFRYIDKAITTRIQILQQMAEGKVIPYVSPLGFHPFEQNTSAYSIKAYEMYAKKFESNYKYKTNPVGSDGEELDESEFWNLVANPNCKGLKTKVEYAADLPVSKYGSGFPLTSLPNWRDADFEYETSLWNLNNLYKSQLSLLKIASLRNEKISGVTSPWVYMGMKFASFCWHVEDLFINSVNYNHKGMTKTWYIVPKSEKEKFDEFVRVKYPKQVQTKPDFLHRITLMIDPLELRQFGIKVYKIRQNQRCYVVTFSKVYHAGFSHGFNICEAVNFVSPISYPYIKEACKNYEKSSGKKMAIFPIEWVAYENYVNRETYKRPEEYTSEIQIRYKQVLKAELQAIQNLLNTHNIPEFSFYDKKSLRYDKNPCFVCKSYCYLNHLRCLKCPKIYCQYHVPKVCCQEAGFRLMLRQVNEDRKEVLKLLEGKLKQIANVE